MSSSVLYRHQNLLPKMFNREIANDSTNYSSNIVVSTLKTVYSGRLLVEQEKGL